MILQGARQVGKSHALRWLGETHYEETITLNFERDPLIGSLFTETLDLKVLLRNISSYFGKTIHPKKTLIIFDEIQECNAALNSLKYFCEEAKEYHIAAAGSLLGVMLSSGRSFPVGKVDFLDIFPMTFMEFLDGIGQSRLREEVESKKHLTQLSQAFHQKLLNHLTQYFIIGGMPEVVASYSANGDIKQARRYQDAILTSYHRDFAKHAPPGDVPKISMVWNSIPNHLARENKRFIFSALRSGARGREFESALQWLHDAGLIHFCNRITKAALPLRSYVEPGIFKVYALDVGLLGAMADLPTETLFRGSRVFQELHGAFIENFVAQELRACGQKLYYWESDGKAEVDFVFQTPLMPVPLETKAGINVKSKSLASFRAKHPELSRAARTNLLNFDKSGGIENYPLYALGQCVKRALYCDDRSDVPDASKD